MQWETVQIQPGFFGRHRNERYAEFDREFGLGRWRIAWRAGEVAAEFVGAMALYEDAYFAHFCSRPCLVSELVQSAEEVYDDAPSNVMSGYDYARQETVRTHLQDIAIRRCVLRLGLSFKGSNLIQIRGRWAAEPVHPLGLLSPGSVPFHRPDLIHSPRLEGWWEAGSIEDWYQSNKVVQVLS